LRRGNVADCSAAAYPTAAPERAMWQRTATARARRRMVRKQIAARGVTNQRVLAAMASIPREAFVSEHQAAEAYADTPLGIGYGQTISQPYIVAAMTEAAAIGRHSRVLDIGTGSGYQAAILAYLAKHVWSVERIPALADDARRRLATLGVKNVSVLDGDGATGYATAAPYDAIVVAAAAPQPPPALLDQLAIGGRLVIPVGDRDLQDLAVIERTPTGFPERRMSGCRFVPLISPDAFPERN